MSRPLSATEHSPHCTQPGFEWQAPILDGLPRRGRCRGCGAVAIHRGSQEPPRRIRTRGGDAA